MATSVYIPNHFKYQFGKRLIKFDSDIFKCILLQSGFSFNIDTHATLADVSGSELANGNGYVTGGVTIGRYVHPDLSGAYRWYEDTVANRGVMKFFRTTWMASGGSIGPVQGAILYDYTSSDNTIICYLELTSTFTASPGFGITVGDITITLG